MDTPRISVIVLNYNGLSHLDTVLGSLERQSYPRSQFEIVLADNASTDGSIDFVHQHYPRVRTVVFDKNYGFAEGNNLAARQATGSVLAFLNNDTEADPQWLSALAAAHEQNPDGLYGSQAFQFAARTISANSLTKLTAWGVPLNVQVFMPRSSLSNKTQHTFYADAAGMLISKDIFFQLGGFERTYFAYEEEKDLSWKAWLSGYQVYLVPSSVYYHRGGSTLGQNSPRAAYLLWRNGLQNMIKYLSGPRLAGSLIVHMGYTLATFVIFFLPQGKWRLAWSQLSAYGAVLVKLPTLLKLRRGYQRSRHVGDSFFVRDNLTLPLSQSWTHIRTFMKLRQDFLRQPTPDIRK